MKVCMWSRGKPVRQLECEASLVECVHGFTIRLVGDTHQPHFRKEVWDACSFPDWIGWHRPTPLIGNPITCPQGLGGATLTLNMVIPPPPEPPAE